MSEQEPIKIERIDNGDGAYIKKVVFIKPDENGWLSAIEKYNQYNKFYYGEYYLDKEFTLLHSKQEYVYDEDGLAIVKIKYTEPEEFGYLSNIQKYDKNNKPYYSEYYNDNDFNILNLIVEINYNNDNSYSKKFILTSQDENGWLSYIEHYDKNNKFYYGKFYTDTNFKNLGMTKEYIYYEDNSYIIKYKYLIPNKFDYLSQIDKYNKNNQCIYSEYFEDSNFNKILASKETIYNKDNSKIEKFKYTKTHNGLLSAIQKDNQNNLCIYAFAYIDKDFKTLFRKSYFKYTKMNNMIILREYTKPNNNVYSEIEKYDLDNNLIYKKQYKFKGLLAKIIFWLSW